MPGSLGAAVALALLASGVAAAATAWRARVRARSRDERPGASPARAIAVPDFHAVDARVRGEPCPCGERRMSVTGEGTARHDGRRLRVVRLACPRCEEEGALHFDVAGWSDGG